MTIFKIYYIHKHIEITEKMCDSCNFFNKKNSEISLH